MTPLGQDPNPSKVSRKKKLLFILPITKGWRAESTPAEKKVRQIFNTRQGRDLNMGHCGCKAEILPLRQLSLEQPKFPLNVRGSLENYYHKKQASSTVIMFGFLNYLVRITWAFQMIYLFLNFPQFST